MDASTLRARIRNELGGDASDALIEELASLIGGPPGMGMAKMLGSISRAGVPGNGLEPCDLDKITKSARTLRLSIRNRLYSDPGNPQSPWTTSALAHLDNVANALEPSTWPSGTLRQLPAMLEILEKATEAMRQPGKSGRPRLFWRRILAVEIGRVLDRHQRLSTTRDGCFHKVLALALEEAAMPAPEDPKRLLMEVVRAIKRVQKPT